MQVLFIILNDLNYLEDILDVFVEKQVRGATILDSEGMAKAVLKEKGVSFLNSPFGRLFPKQADSSKTIFTVITEDNKVEEVVNEIRNLLNTGKEKVIGFMFTVPVSGIYPIKPKK